MIVAALLLAAQDATPPAPRRFSILQPTPGDCSPSPAPDGTVVVCGTVRDQQHVPLPDDYIPTRPRPSNPNLTGAGALAAAGTPCAALQGGCQVGFGPPIMPIAKALVGMVKNAVRAKPNKAGRVAIPLDSAVPLPGYKP